MACVPKWSETFALFREATVLVSDCLNATRYSKKKTNPFPFVLFFAHIFRVGLISSQKGPHNLFIGYAVALSWERRGRGAKKLL